jgi:hypothetical protein
MTEYELEDLVTSTSLASVESFGMYVTVLASYMVVAYLAGRRLTKLQAATASTLFVVASALAAYTSASYHFRVVQWVDALELMNPNKYYGAQPFVGYWMGGIMGLGILASYWSG